MKISFLAVALGDIKLSKVHRSNRIVGKINNLIDDSIQHISPDMTGDDIIEWYTGLDVTLQNQIDRVNLFDKAEREYIVKDLQNLREEQKSKKHTQDKLYQLSVGFLATTMVLISLLATCLYYLNAKHNGLLVHSNLTEGIAALFVKTEKVVETISAETGGEPPPELPVPADTAEEEPVPELDEESEVPLE